TRFSSPGPTASGVCALSLHDALPIWRGGGTGGGRGPGGAGALAGLAGAALAEQQRHLVGVEQPRQAEEVLLLGGRAELPAVIQRSEEHRSELQSPYDLVCRLLLEKKK